MHPPGIHLKAIAYPTPFEGNLSPEEKMSYVDPTMSIMSKVCVTNVLSLRFTR